ncbi:MAG: hypothetical protein J6R89_00455, partial [Clostridia bacterium]|nr:hypothetical protein [Clostridia bacterium]
VLFMKKRLLSLLLVLCTLLAMVPVMGVAADEVLPKDETPGASSTETPAGSHSFTDYDALYVGADGQKTANGGKLIGLYTAYTGDTTLDIAGGKWKNKMDATGATDAILRDTSDDYSFVAEGNGFGYHMSRDKVAASEGKKMGITFPEAWAALSNYTVEHAARFDVIESTTPLAIPFAAIRIENFHGLWIPGSKTMSGNDCYCMRWRIDSKADYGANFTGSGTQEFAYRDGYAVANKAATLVTSYTKTLSDNTVKYAVNYNTGATLSSKELTIDELAAMSAASNITQPKFSLFNGMSGTFYAVRVYDAPLTAAERSQNAMADMLAYTGVDISGYMSLDPLYRTMLTDSLVSGVFPEKAAVEETINKMLEFVENQLDLTETLYVTEGLTFFASAFNGLTTDYSGTDTIEWANALNPAEHATLRGGFYKNEKGGFTIVKDAADIRGSNTNPTSVEFSNAWNSQKNMGIYMPASALPTGDYTVETTYNPVGITERNADGTIERYVDTLSSSGNVVHARGMAIGPFCASLHSCMRVSDSGSLEKRWYYSANKSLDQLGWAYDYSDFSWSKLGLYEVVTYAITHDHTNAGGSSYSI